MSDIFGLNSYGSSESAVLQSSLESRLRARLDASGSPEYALTWKLWAIGVGAPICALRASARRTFGNGSTGWPTPNAMPESRGGLQTSAAQLAGWTTPQAHDATARGSGQKEKHGTKHGCADLNRDAQLAGWVTPSTRDWKDTPGMATNGVNPDGSTRKRTDQLPRQAALAGWPTPNIMSGGQTSRGGNRKDEPLMGGLARGLTPEPSSAATAAPAGFLLNPRFSLWLQGYPDAWASCGERATRLSRRSQPSSSKPISKP